MLFNTSPNIKLCEYHNFQFLPRCHRVLKKSRFEGLEEELEILTRNLGKTLGNFDNQQLAHEFCG